MASAADYPMMREQTTEVADTELWRHLISFSKTLLRSELEELRKQLKEDIKDMSTEIYEVVGATRSEASRRGSDISNISSASANIALGSRGGSMSAPVSQFGPRDSYSTPREERGSKRQVNIPIVKMMSRRPRTFTAAAEISRQQEKFEAMGDLAGTDAMRRASTYSKKQAKNKSQGPGPQRQASPQGTLPRIHSANLQPTQPRAASGDAKLRTSMLSASSNVPGQRPNTPNEEPLPLFEPREASSPSFRGRSVVRFEEDFTVQDTLDDGPEDFGSTIAASSENTMGSFASSQKAAGERAPAYSWGDNTPMELPGSIGEQPASPCAPRPKNEKIAPLQECPTLALRPAPTTKAAEGGTGDPSPNEHSLGVTRYAKAYINPEEDIIRNMKIGRSTDSVDDINRPTCPRSSSDSFTKSTATNWHQMTGWDRVRYRLQLFVRRQEFDCVTGILIVVNAATIGIQTDVAAQSNSIIPSSGFRILEGFFCAAFTIELILRIMAYGLKFFWMFGWRWNIFDCFVVGLQLVETFVTFLMGFILDEGLDIPVTSMSIFRIFRILRLIRIIRVIRVLRFISDLRTLVYSVFGTLRQFLWTVLLIGLLIYITGVQFTQIIADYKNSLDLDDPVNQASVNDLNKHWGSLSISILSLFASVSGGVDWQNVVDPMIEHIHPILAVLFCAYVSFGVFALLNVVTGIFVQSAMVAAKQDNETYVVNQIRELFEHADCDGSGVVSWEKFSSQLDSKEMKEYFKHLDIDIAEATGVFSLLDLNSDGELSADEFLNGSLRLRGTARALEMEVMMRAISDCNEVARHSSSLVEDLMNEMYHIQRSVGALRSTSRESSTSRSNVSRNTVQNMGSESSIALVRTVPQNRSSDLSVDLVPLGPGASELPSELRRLSADLYPHTPAPPMVNSWGSESPPMVNTPK